MSHAHTVHVTASVDIIQSRYLRYNDVRGMLLVSNLYYMFIVVKDVIDLLGNLSHETKTVGVEKKNHIAAA